MSNRLVKPFLKWAGGKRQIVPEILEHIPDKGIKTYYEPFLGGGAVLFSLQPQKARVNDLNKELVNVYLVIKNQVEALIQDLEKHKNDKDYFYKIREMDRGAEFRKMTDVQRASRIIYLNKTCYNGLFRVNSKGQFNTPFGRYKKPNIVNAPVLRAVSDFLSNNDIELMNTDFDVAVKGADKDSFVYLDPPYHPISDSSFFTGYTFNGFSLDDQIRLKKVCDNLNKRGCKFLLSNSSAEFIFDLYKDYKIKVIAAGRNINSIAKARGDVNEVLIRNY